MLQCFVSKRQYANLFNYMFDKGDCGTLILIYKNTIYKNNQAQNWIKWLAFWLAFWSLSEKLPGPRLIFTEPFLRTAE